MTKSSALRVAPGAEGVSIWSSEIFGDAEASRLRDFLARAFSVREVQAVELRRAKAFGRISYGAVSSPGQIWKKLSRALGSSDDALALSTEPARVDADLVFLDGRITTPVRVSRIGESLSTWRVRQQSEDTLRLWHPVLRNRRDVVFRLEEELAAILGIEDFSASTLTAGVSIRFDKRALTAALLARELEKAWPRLLDGLDGPPSRTRLVASVGLLGLAFTGQYVVPALRPLAVAGVALYSAPNAIDAVKQLRRGQVGLSAMYTAGLGFMLNSGMPFNSAAIAVFTQFWPHLARRKIVRSQRRLFAGPRRRAVSARLSRDAGNNIEVNVDRLHPGDVVVVRSGESVPVDGVVESGLGAVVVDALFGGNHVEDRSQGDPINAGAFVRDGELKIRVERAGAKTAASYLASLLPHSVIPGMPCSLEAERIANRNARPALALAALNLALTRSPRVSQLLLRPDYATAPRLSAQLSTLHGLAHGVQRGLVFRNPAALDRVAGVEVFIFDESAGLDRRHVEVANVQIVSGVSAEHVVGYALAALAVQEARGEQGRALAAYAEKSKIAPAHAEGLSRHAGVTRYRDSGGSAIEVATASYLSAAKREVSARLQAAPARRLGAGKSDGPARPVAARRSEAPLRKTAEEITEDSPATRPLWVVRDGQVVGVVSFARSGELVGKQIVTALKAQNEKARIAYLSASGDAQVQGLAGALGIDFARGELSQTTKVDLIRGLGAKTVWIGDGSAPHAREAIAASTVSISVAPLARAREDAADVLVPLGLAGLSEVIELGRAHAKRLVRDYRTVYSANLLSLAGISATRFNSLHAGLLSNLGTGVVYARRARALNRLVQVADARRAQLEAATVA